MRARARRRSLARDRMLALAETLTELSLDQLREAIRSNSVSFPSPVPWFRAQGHPDLQWRLAQLYFVLGWDCNQISAKFGIHPRQVRKILRLWCRNAEAAGYLQRIPLALSLNAP